MYYIVLVPKNGDNPITIDSTVYGDRSRKTISPQLELEENAFGSLTFTLPSFNDAYDDFEVSELSMAEVLVYHVDELDPVFRGRLLEVRRDSQKNRMVTFEGELAYLADTVQEPAEYKEITPDVYVGKLLAVHNRKSPQKFMKGVVTVTDNNSADHITRRVNRGSYSVGYSDTTWSCLQSLVGELGGYFRVRWEDGVRYLDYLKDHDNSCIQAIELGSNLLDYAEEWSLAELYTVVVPIGAKVETNKTDENGNKISEDLTIASVNGGSVYLEDRTDIIERYGRREKCIKFSGISNPYNLFNIAVMYLNNIQFDNMVLNLTALDLYELGLKPDRLKFQSVVHATAAPFGLDKDFPITKVSIPLKDPGHAVYTMSTNTRGIRSISDKITDIYDEIQDTADDTSEDIEEVRNEIKNSASPVVDPDEWMFGIPQIVFPADDFAANLLYHTSFMLRGWDVGRGWKGDGETREFTKPGGSTDHISLHIGLPDIVLTEQLEEDWLRITHGRTKEQSTEWADIEKSGVLINFGWGTSGVLPVTTKTISEGLESGCRVLYLVVQFDDSSNGVVGFYTGTEYVLFGSNNSVLCKGSTSASKSSWSNFEPSSIVGSLAIQRTIPTDKPVIFAFSHGVIKDDEYPTAYNLIIGSDTLRPNDLKSGVCFPNNSGASDVTLSNLNGFFLNYEEPFNSPASQYINDGTTPISEDPDHTLSFCRAVECRGLSGQITMTEVVENVEWLVGRFVTGSISDDNGELPGYEPEPTPEPEPEEEGDD